MEGRGGIGTKSHSDYAHVRFDCDFSLVLFEISAKIKISSCGLVGFLLKLTILIEKNILQLL